MATEFRIGCAKGDLGEAQARALVTQLSKLLTNANVSAVPVDADGAVSACDAVFASPLDIAVLNQKVDAYVASLQSIAVLLPEGLILASVTQRVDLREAAVTGDGLPLRAMPEGTQVVVDGARRAHQVKMVRADLEPVITIISPEKLLASIESGNDQAGIFAMSDLCWMRNDDRAAEILSVDEMLPGPGQGALGLVVRDIDAAFEKCVLTVNHKPTWACVRAERELISALGWNACAPVGVLAEIVDGAKLKLRASAFGAQMGEVVCAEGVDSADNFEQLARTVADDLLRAGGERIIREARQITY
jgi:hydroxymethylbilane synthase